MPRLARIGPRADIRTFEEVPLRVKVPMETTTCRRTGLLRMIARRKRGLLTKGLQRSSEEKTDILKTGKGSSRGEGYKVCSFILHLLSSPNYYQNSKHNKLPLRRYAFLCLFLSGQTPCHWNKQSCSPHALGQHRRHFADGHDLLRRRHG